jgi:hypothetical protein
MGGRAQGLIRRRAGGGRAVPLPAPALAHWRSVRRGGRRRKCGFWWKDAQGLHLLKSDQLEKALSFDALRLRNAVLVAPMQTSCL